ncbi:hypothetical protein BJ138DRAFT_1117110 [Hygrophoropsis aurantiaca]|uniref:Uncharacterized protein n=1 Tax=Hygrophoropsis aurantiaca TaxID=72124 RepID=A0ACB8A0N9_9AGAM|nr:hypothetical protein BJ138DRAFT_1117110 [Hygrophoropsis aurantiaca]
MSNLTPCPLLGINIFLVTNWTANIFVLAMQAILLVRAYALCQRSNIVLALLLTCYCSLALAVWVLSGLCYNIPVMKQFLPSLGSAIGSVQQIANSDPTVFGNYPLDITILFVSFDILVLLVALYAFMAHVLAARRTHAGWSANSLVKILMGDQILYFLCFVGWMIISLASNYAVTYNEYEVLTNILNILNALSVITGPRMVIRIRAHEVRGRRDETELGGEELQTIRFIAHPNEDDATLT